MVFAKHIIPIYRYNYIDSFDSGLFSYVTRHTPELFRSIDLSLVTVTVQRTRRSAIDGKLHLTDVATSAGPSSQAILWHRLVNCG
jgi:hypothetical protein